MVRDERRLAGKLFERLQNEKRDRKWKPRNRREFISHNRRLAVENANGFQLPLMRTHLEHNCTNAFMHRPAHCRRSRHTVGSRPHTPVSQLVSLNLEHTHNSLLNPLMMRIEQRPAEVHCQLRRMDEYVKFIDLRTDYHFEAEFVFGQL